jgi:hypothetical protein
VWTRHPVQRREHVRRVAQPVEMEDKKAAVETAVLQALDKAGAIDDSRTLGLDMKLVDGAVRSLLAFEMITCEVRAGAAAAVPQPSPIAPGSALQAQKPPTHLSRGCLRSLADRHALHGPADGAGPGFRLNPRQIPRAHLRGRAGVGLTRRLRWETRRR